MTRLDWRELVVRHARSDDVELAAQTIDELAALDSFASIRRSSS